MEICGNCNGEGSVSEKISHHNEWEAVIEHSNEWEIITCKRCKGTGRMKRYDRGFSVPFGTNIEIINNCNDKINEAIHELQQKLGNP